MRNAALSSAAALLLSLPLSVTAATLYVDVNNLAPATPYADWTTAATNIQDAVDLAGVGDEVVVTNGVYQTGGRLVSGTTTNRLAVTNAITVQSVNGPSVTVIQGYQVPGTTNGTSAVRCVYLVDGAVLAGFTLTNGATGVFPSSVQADASGGGAWCQSTNACLSNCVLVANSCSWWGAGAYSGKLLNCELNGNINLNQSGDQGGAAAFGWLVGCTLSGNRTTSGGVGGALSCYLSNCVVAGSYNNGASGCTLNGCLVTGNHDTGVIGGVANNCTISSNTTPYTGVNTYGGGASGAILSNCLLYANVATNGAGAYNCSLSFCTLSNNCATRYGGGIYVDGLVSPVITNCRFVGNTAGNAGGGLYASAANQLVLSRCVFTGNAATNYGGGYGGPAGAVDSCAYSNNWAGSAGGAIYIPSPGGGRAFTNCVFYNNAASTSGGGTYFANLSQCSIIGNQAPSGGGACYGALTGCSLSSNSATLAGGGMYAGTLDSCVLTGNQAGNGGAAATTTLSTCTLADNLAATNGGGAWNGTLYNCLLTRNNALSGGGAYGNTLYNCTLVNNTASNSGGGTAGSFRAYNSIIYYNTAPASSNYDTGTLSACCAMPLRVSNISNAPVFVDMLGGNFRLQTNSPCINAGHNSYASGVDLDHRTRIVGGTVDIGAYEFQGPGMSEFIGWLQEYGLPTDGSADYIDTDGDGMNNWQEWICGTDPTSALSVLVMLAASNSVSGVTLNWQGVTNRTYFLERSTNLLVQPAFTPIQSNIVGQAGTTSFTDTNAAGAGPFLYRVGVQ